MAHTTAGTSLQSCSKRFSGGRAKKVDAGVSAAGKNTNSEPLFHTSSPHCRSAAVKT